MAVLIVVDDPAIRRVRKRILEHAGFAVTAVENGLAAFDELYRESYDAILYDLDMPVLNGTGFFEQLEERLPEMACRVVFLTGLLDESASQKLSEQTGQPCLEKTTAPEMLVASIQQVSECSDSGGWCRR